MSKISLKCICLVILLSVGIESLKNKELGDNDNPTPYINTLEEVEFSKTDINIVPESQKFFAFLNKESGKLERVVELAEDEKFLINSCPQMVITNKKKRVKFFNCDKKKLSISKYEGLEGIDQIISHAYLSGKLYVLTNKDLRIYQQSSQLNNYKIIFEKPKKTEKGEQVFFKSIFIKDTTLNKERIGLFSYFENKQGKALEVCIRSFVEEKMVENNPICINMNGQKMIDVIRKGSEVLIVMTQKTYILKNDFQVQTVIEGQAEKGDGKFISLGNKIYDVEKDAIYQDLVAFQRKGSNNLKLEKKKNKYDIYFENQKTKLGEIQIKNGLEAKKFWFQMDQSNKNCEILIQWQNNDLTYHTIVEKNVKNIWEAKGNSQ